MPAKKDTPKINIDGTEYDLDKLSDKTKSIIGFIQRLDKEVVDLRFQLDKATLARKQAVIDLKEEIDEWRFLILGGNDNTSSILEYLKWKFYISHLTQFP